MKKFLQVIKDKYPIYQKRFIESIPFIMIYQAILFILSPTKLNQVVLVIMIIFFAFTQFGLKD